MSTNYVRTGLWTDYSEAGLNRHHYLVTDYQSGIITNTLAILITSTGSPILKLFKHPLNWLWKKVSSSWGASPPASPQDPEELRELAIRAAAESAGLHFQDDYQLIPPNTPTASNGPDRPLGFLGLAAMLLALFAPKVILIVVSILSAGLATGKLAISSNPDCGEYEFNFDSLTSSVSFVRYERSAESQAAEYAQNCYGPASIATQCNKFYSQNITYMKTDTASCPFDGAVCGGGKNEAFRLTTGLVSGALLGINAANPYFFERATTCTPMVTGEKYVMVGISDRKEKQWEYRYGRGLADYTWSNPVGKSSWAIKGYSMGVQCYDPADSKPNFNPLPGFRAGPYPVTLMFISSHSILYPHYRDDPIFPAHTKAKFPPDYKGPTYYYNNSTRAGVLGCVDEYQICKTRSGPCWNNKNITWAPAPSNRNATEEDNVAKLLTLALDFSTSCGSVQYRQAEALDAQMKLADTQSLPLAPKQWHVEAEKIFQTSLARMQSNTYDIVRGTAAGFDGYQNVMDPKYKGICGLVKIPTIGWTDIHFWGFMGTCFAVIFVWVLSIRLKTGSRDMVGVFLWKKVLVPVAWGLFVIVTWAWEHSKPLREWLDLYFVEPSSKRLQGLMTCS